VDDAYICHSEEPTTLAMVDACKSGDPRYVFYLADTSAWSWRETDLPGKLPLGVEAVHVGSFLLIAPSAKRPVDRLFRAVSNRVTLSFDPNVRRELITDLESYRARIEEAVARSDIVRASEEDLDTLYPHRGWESVAASLRSLGPRLVVVSRGKKAPVALVGDDVLVGPTYPSDVVDTVGGGDTFTAGLLASLSAAGVLGNRLAGVTPDHVAGALELAACAAAIACGRLRQIPPHSLRSLIGDQQEQRRRARPWRHSNSKNNDRERERSNYADREYHRWDPCLPP
jgi:fructokinase